MDDRLRNGVLLCDLLLILEPSAARHVSLTRRIHRKPISLKQVTLNITTALWLLRVRKCPPVPLKFLIQNAVDFIMKGQKDVVWGLLLALKHTYTYTNDSTDVFTTSDDDVSSRSYSSLPYSREQMRMLSESLLQWVERKDLLSTPAPPSPPTLLYMERDLMNGTLLCRLASILVDKHASGIIHTYVHT